MTTRAFPKIPETVYSTLGPVSVTQVKDLLNNEAFGLFSPSERTIQIEQGAGKETQWQTLFHEVAHLALWDAGTIDILNQKQEEAVCNALGTYLASAVQAGFLTVKKPRA